MGARLDSSSFEALLDRLEQRSKDVSPVNGELHRECLRQMASGGIPSDTGRLRASLTEAGHPDHLFEADKNGIRFGSHDPAARYNARAVPSVKPGPLLRILARHVFGGE